MNFASKLAAWLIVIAGTSVVFAGTPPGSVHVNQDSTDPASIERFGPAYRYPRSGWVVLHIEGEPYERGYQHGRLMADEIADYVRSLASLRSVKAPSDGWRDARLTVDAVFLRRYNKEFLEEMKGIADGAAAGGAKFEGRPLDLLDIAVVNSEIELAFLDSALEATPVGLEGKRFPEPVQTAPARPGPPHCSAFAATGPATADGKIVFGHITMFNLAMVRFFHVRLDVKPNRGHRVLMQTYPGGIQSGMDYYMNDAGLLVAETTIKQTRFDIAGEALASRIRRALQYSNSIDSAVEILKKDNNGMYTNEWLLGDVKTDEIAMFELGTRKSKLWRSGNNEWPGGTEGFYWGCNNAKDLEVRLETIAGLDDRPVNVVFHPSERDIKWISLYKSHKGKIDVDFGFEAFTTPPLAAYPSCDAKFTTSELAKELKTYAIFGPPLERTWAPTSAQKLAQPSIEPLVPNDWTLLSAEPPASSNRDLHVVDLPLSSHNSASTRSRGESNAPVAQFAPPRRSPVWRGTITPADDRDIWLAAAFADYERIVAHEKSIHELSFSTKARESALAIARFGPWTRYKTAAVRLGRDIPLIQTQTDYESNDWYEIAAGKGVLVLEELRKKLGEEKFIAMMDEFGRSHAGKPATTAEFRAAAEKAHGGSLAEFFDRVLEEKTPSFERSAGFWSIDSFEAEPDKAVIVYGTLNERAAQRESADLLQAAIRRRWTNITVPIVSDREATEEILKSHHVILIGRPATNAIAARYASAFPIHFGTASFTIDGETYAAAHSAVSVSAANPLNPRFSFVLNAGLSAWSTWTHAESRQDDRRAEPAQAVVFPASGGSRSIVFTNKDLVVREASN